MLATIESPSFAQEVEATDTTEIYGLIPKPEDGLEEIKLLWTRRTASSYQKISLDLGITNTLWRNARNGSLGQWTPKMLSDIGKREGAVIENYICMNILPVFTQQRLALEQMGICRNQIFKSYNLLQKSSSPVDVQKLNLVLCFGELSTEISHYPGTLDLEENFGDILEVLPIIVEITGDDDSFNDFSNIFEIARFEKLDTLVRSSQWVDNCLQVQEIYQKRLFRFRYNSFDEYCKSSKISQGTRRVKIGEVIRQIQQDTDLPLPLNRGQAHALSEIPTENRLNTWQATLDSKQKLSARLILQIHAKEIGARTNPELLNDTAPMLGKIDVLLSKTREPIPESVQAFIYKVRRMNVCSNLELKMLKTIATCLQDKSKSDRTLETTQNLSN